MVARGRELRLELALEAGVVGAWLYDAATHELTWEAPMYQIFRVPLGTPVTLEDFLARVHPDDRGRFEASIARTLEGSDFREEYRIITSRGERWVMIRAQLLTDGKSDIEGVEILAQPGTPVALVEIPRALRSAATAAAKEARTAGTGGNE